MSRLRNIAVVAFSQAPIVTRDEHRVASEILYPEVRSALDQCDVERAAIDYQVAGSADYIDGRPFGFVTALDVMGSWPAKQDLHLEMDAATSRSEEHTSELQSLAYLVCRLLLEKKKKKKIQKHKM